MTRIRFIPAQVKTFPDERPDACKYCGSQILTQHGTADTNRDRPLRGYGLRLSDTDAPTAREPSGITRRGSTAAGRPSGCADGRALAWALGLSLRSASHLLAAFRRLGLAHERVARRSGKRVETRARKQSEGAGGTRESDRRGRDGGSRERREKDRRRSHGRRNRAGSGGWTYSSSATRTDSWSGSATS